jgi:hypothetical protein
MIDEVENFEGNFVRNNEVRIIPESGSNLKGK